ncbi:hypothetical protein ACNQR7_03520 [Mycolicibacterium senegalense]|uniref:hypothetical protein n=1 Tax=Mycolicibacterium TaxID=1866885 RepID=UPI0032049E48
MRLRRRLFRPQVHITRERGRPITVTLAGLEFDLTVLEAERFAAHLISAIDEVEGVRP